MLIRGLSKHPFLRLNEDGENAGGGNDPKPAENDADKLPDIPVKDMTPEQQAKFHQQKARRLEDTLKGFNGLTPKQVADLQKELADERAKSLTADERAIEAAKEAGRNEVRTVLGLERFKNAFSKAIEGRTPDAAALIDLDRSKFINGDTVDADALRTWVEANSTASGDPKPKPKAPNLGQGPRDNVPKTPGEHGRAEAQKRFAKKKTSTTSDS